MGEMRKKKDIILTYTSNFIQFNSNVLLDYYFYLFYNKRTMNSLDMAKQLKEEIKHYFSFVQPEVAILFFSIQNFSKIDITDFENCFLGYLNDELYQNQDYLTELFENFEISLDMNRTNRFYAPKKKEHFKSPEEKKEFYSSYLKGFNKESLKYQLEIKKILTETKINQLFDKATFCDIMPLSEPNSSKQEVLKHNFTLPKIKNEETYLANIAEFVRQAILLAPNRTEELINSSDISIFYQLLIQKELPFHTIKIESTRVADKLLECYQNEPIEKQIEKVKQLKK